MNSSRQSILQNISGSLDQITLGQTVSEPSSDPIISIIQFLGIGGFSKALIKGPTTTIWIWNLHFIL